jgi:NAD-dependent dihydropyrimidine dehydrogenase PreA subunit
MGLFIEVTLENSNPIAPEVGNNLATSCPVDIFTWTGSELAVVREQEDECTLCELCLDLAPRGAIVIHKRYKNEFLVSRGSHCDDPSQRQAAVVEHSRWPTRREFPQ